MMDLTVGITSYNQCGLLVEAIDSVLAQTLRPREIIIVDDASEDDSPQLIRSYAAQYPDLVRPILLARNSGPNAARNHVIEAAQGQRLSFLDGDDRWLPTKLEREAARLNGPDRPDAVFSNFYFTAKDGAHMFLWATDQTPPEGYLLPQVLMLDLPRTTLFRSEIAPTNLWHRAGQFDASFAIYGDWDMKIRLAAQVPRFGYVDEPLCEYRRHGAGISNKPVEMHLAAVDHIEQKYAPLVEQLAATHSQAIGHGLDHFRAKLWRRGALDVCLQRPANFRKTALGLYKRSWQYDRVLDPRLLWHLFKP
ncbi:MAG: glycosyltransferase [Chloroflexota bacterium]